MGLPAIYDVLGMYGRDDVTRTRDPYVPNVVRYQLRYIPMFRSFRGIVIPQKLSQEKRSCLYDNFL